VHWVHTLLRPASPSDLEGVYRIEITCFKERRFRRDHVDWILRNERGLTLVEDDGHGLDGAIMLLFEGQVCRVLSVATMPESRRRGLGREMMQTAERVGRGRGCAQVHLEVSTQNYEAIEFYRHLGYRTDGVLYGYYSWGEDAYSMTKSLVRDPQGAGEGQRALNK
jgi:ribosomal-protein-alanine N-acetyltransferase